MGAIASKKYKFSFPFICPIASDKLAEVNGPDAMIAGPSGSSRTSSRITSMRGWDLILEVTNFANSTRSTANAPPAGNAVRSAHSMSNDFNSRSSSLRSPEARSGKFDPRELEQTSSARSGVKWAPVFKPGRISYSFTIIPRWAACHAASLPPRPPPMTINFSDIPNKLDQEDYM